MQLAYEQFGTTVAGMFCKSVYIDGQISTVLLRKNIVSYKVSVKSWYDINYLKNNSKRIELFGVVN